MGFFSLRQKDVDTVERAYKAKFIAWYFGPAVFLGAIFLVFVNPIAALFVTIIVPFLMYLIIGKLAQGTANIYYSSGSKAEKQYSRQKALIMEEKYEDAIELYRFEIVNDPEDFRAQIAIADLICDELSDYSRAIKEYRKAQSMNLPDDYSVYVSNRIVDIYSNEMPNIIKAIGECKRIIRSFPNSQAATNAQIIIDRLEEMKENSE
jgi:tetratricopeptide (TPR) repeat protein